MAALAAVLLAFPTGALAQKKDEEKKEDAPEGEGDGGDKTDQQKAVEAYQAGKKLAEEGDLEAAIEKYQEAYELFPDPLLVREVARAQVELENWDEAIAAYEEAYEAHADPQIWIEIGRVYAAKVKGEEDLELYKENLTQAIEYFNKYLEEVPEGESEETDVLRQEVQAAIEKIEEKIGQADETIAKREEEERKKKEEEEEKKRLERERLLKEKKEREGMQLALDGMLTAGIEDDLTGIGRLIAGGFIGWGAFAVEAHLSFDAFLRVDNGQGISGRSITVADVGTRLSFTGNRFLGPFVSAGAGFGVFSGSPRERKVSGDMETCAGFQDAEGEFNCSFDVDRNISTRLGLGWGFEANKKTTVAVRLDLNYWFYSVDDNQPTGSPRAADVEKPQGGPSIFLGLEFMRWK